jgi:hypothetical protein
LGLGRFGGKSGAIRCHNSSVSSGLAMCVSPLVHTTYRPNHRPKITFC